MVELNEPIRQLEQKAPYTNKWVWVSRELYKQTGYDLTPNAVRKRHKRFSKGLAETKQTAYKLGEDIVTGLVKGLGQQKKYSQYVPLTGKNVLVIGDTHLPFVASGYLDFVKRLRDKYNCDAVVHIGDVLDQHTLAKFVNDPDGFSTGNELERVLEQISQWYVAFPDMKICIGNHDSRMLKTAMAAGLSTKYLKHFNDILGTPTWEWHWSYVQDGDNGQVLYTHGSEKGGELAHYNFAKTAGINIVMGHTHSKPGVVWLETHLKQWFALNVGCGIDKSAYAFAYGINNSYAATLGAGVVLENGTEPLFVRYVE